MHLVFLPGVGGDGHVWDPVAAAFIAEHHITMPDWPGLGPIPPSPAVSSFDDLASLVLRQLDSPAILIAQSMGGVVAITAALRRPDLICGLVLCATSGGVDLSAHGAHSWHDTHRQRWPGAPAWVFDRPPDLTPALATITAPTQLIWAADDPLSPLSVGHHLATHLPDAQLHTVDTDDHQIAVNDPRHAITAIHDLLACIRDIGSPAEVRRYRDGDAAALAAVFYASVRNGARRDYTPEQVEAWLPRPVDPTFFSTRAGDGRTLFVATVADTIIGYGDLEPDGHIDHLYCAPDWIGRGIGERLYLALEADARARGLTALYVEASEPARRLFARHGFTIRHRNDLVRNNVAIHNYTMDKTL